MEKVYLKYDDIRPCVECDYGFAGKMVYMGFLYPFFKGDLTYFSVVLALQISVCILLCVLFSLPVLVKLMLCIIMLIIINILFACNYNLLIIEKLLKEGYYPMDYNSSDKLIKKGIYFKLQ